MEKLTLEQLAPYLPYGLTCIIPLYQEKGVLNVEQISKNRVWVSKRGSSHLWQHQYISNIKPILRPLSDLNNSDLMKNWRKQHDMSMSDNRLLLKLNGATLIDILGFPMEFLNELLKHHFDVFGLIAAGLAVDMNTLEGGSSNGN